MFSESLNTLSFLPQSTAESIYNALQSSNDKPGALEFYIFFQKMPRGTQLSEPNKIVIGTIIGWGGGWQA